MFDKIIQPEMLKKVTTIFLQNIGDDQNKNNFILLFKDTVKGFKEPITIKFLDNIVNEIVSRDGAFNDDEWEWYECIIELYDKHISAQKGLL